MPSRIQKWMTHRMLAGSLIALAGLAAYSNSFYGPFIFDDPQSISDNPTIRHLWPIGPVFSPPCNGETVSGRPILNLSFAINYALGGTNVWGYHIVNLTIHLLNGLLLLGVLRRTFLLPALRPRFGRNALLLSSAIALLWVVHPLQTEAVTYIAQRAESLSAMFYLLMLYAVICGSQSQRATFWYVGAIVACWLGMATKEIVVTAPVMVLLYDRTLLAGTFRQAWRQRWGLYLGLAVGWALLVGLIFQRRFLTLAAPESHMPSIWSYARTQPEVILHYLQQVVWPYPLCLGWDWPAAKGWSVIGWLSMLAVGMLLVATIWSLRHSSHRAWGLLGAWFFLILAPSSSVVPLLQLAFEHRMYLPLAGVITLLVIIAYLVGQKWIVHDSSRLAIGLCLVSLVAISLGWMTFERNQDYRSDLSVWKDVATKVPHNALAHNNWGTALRTQGQVSEAIKHFERALQLDSNNADYYYSMSGGLLDLRRPQEAIDYCKKALKLQPNYAEAHYNWGNALLAMNQPAEAIKHFEQAVKLQPDYAEAHMNLGNALSAMGRSTESIEQYELAIKQNPDFALAHFNLAQALAQVGRFKEAIEHGRETVRLMPDNPLVHQQAAWLLATQDPAQGGNSAEAVKLGEKACRLIGHQDIVYLDTLAIAYASAGRFDEAIATAKTALQLAQAARQNFVAKEIFMRLQLYRDRKPYREKTK